MIFDLFFDLTHFFRETLDGGWLCISLAGIAAILELGKQFECNMVERNIVSDLPSGLHLLSASPTLKLSFEVLSFIWVNSS